MLEFLYQLTEFICCFVFADRFNPRNHNTVLDFIVPGKVCKNNTESGSLTLNRTEVGIRVSQTVECSGHALNRSLLDPATGINHNTLNNCRHAPLRVLKLSCQVFILHFEDLVIRQLGLNVIGARCVHQCQLSDLPIITLLGHSLDLSPESERVLRVVQVSLFAEHVHYLVVG